MGFPGGSVVKNPPANTQDAGSIPGLGRFPGEGNGYPLQYSCLGNPMDRGAWQSTVHGVARARHACTSKRVHTINAPQSVWILPTTEQRNANKKESPQRFTWTKHWWALWHALLSLSSEGSQRENRMRSAISCQLLSFHLETQLGKHLLPCAHGSAFIALGSITAFVYESRKGEREEERRRGWGEPATKTETYTMRGNCGIPPITSCYSPVEEASHGSRLPSSGRDAVVVAVEFLNPIWLLSDPMDCSLWGPSAYGISRTETLGGRDHGDHL